MKILMLGWELPPLFAGGVGIVCSELAQALTKQGVEITFVMPSGPHSMHIDYLKKLVIANNIHPGARVKIKTIPSLLHAYQTSEQYEETYEKFMKSSGDSTKKELYGKNIIQEVYRFAAQVALIAQEEEFDVIHAHDWTTFPAAIAAKNVTGKPLVVHMHITEFDKSGGMHANPDIYKIEQQGMRAANLVIAVSNFVKNRCVHQYYIDTNKIRVIHNAATKMNDNFFYDGGRLRDKDKIVLFAGRITLQKGPEYFVDAAQLILQQNPDVTFIMAGSGDMLNRMIDRVAAKGMSHKFIFTGFYTRDEAEKLFSMADVFVMPSVSEPFGVVPYEAQIKQTPTIVSKQSGISEVLHHCLKVDFWDVKALAAKTLALLEHEQLNSHMAINGYYEAKKSNWEDAAHKTMNVYEEVLTW